MPPLPTPSFLSVRDLKGLEGSGRPFASVLVLRKVTPKTASNGNPYLSAEFGDRTGTFNSTVFNDNPCYDAVVSAAEGAVLRVEGKTESYQGRLAPKLSRVSTVSPEELASRDVMERLVQTSSEDPVLLWTEFKAHVESIKLAELKLTVRGVMDELGEAFQTAPAAVSMHHAYRHGLLEHTTHMARAAKALLPLYPEVDPDMAMAGILLHDTGKTIEYEGTLAVKRSRQGILHGHVVLGYQLVRKAALSAKLDPERLERLEHIILSHQGELEWGAAALAATPEAVFVSMVDNLDARMGMVQQALRQATPGNEFTDRIAGLNTPLLARKLPAAGSELF